MSPGGKYFKINGNGAPDDEQALLELSPRVRVDRQIHRQVRTDDLNSQWNSNCVTQLIYLFILVMMAIGFMIHYLPEGGHMGNHHHHHDHNDIHCAEEHHVYKHAAVAAGQLECSTVGKNIMLNGGNAVDAAIATTLCQGVVEPYFSGIGGGAIMTIYNATTKTVTCISSREYSPAAATPKMFIKESGNVRGPNFIAVPGELRGLEYAFKKYGTQSKWAEIFQPAIDKARNGFKASGQMAVKMQELYDKYIVHNKDSYFCELYCNEDKSGVKKEGDIVSNPKLAKTLEQVQKHGVDAFYHGEMAETMINEIREQGGIMTIEDLQNFTVVEQPAIQITLRNAGYVVHAPPLPLGGPVLGGILSIMDLYNVTPFVYEQNPALQWHRTDEAFRHTYGIRYGMGDPVKVPSGKNKVSEIVSGVFAAKAKKKILDHKTFHDPKYYGANFLNAGKSSTSHVSVLAPNKDAVAITSTINYHWGSFVISPTTGVVFNNEMDDFSYPNGNADHDAHLSPANQIEGRKQPLSSMTPAIFLNKDKDPVFIIGAAGGIRIPTSVAQVMLRLMYFSTDDFDEPFRARRLHDSLVPDKLEYEVGFDQQIIEKLRKIGHIVKPMTQTSHVNGIKYHTSHIHAFSDLRNPGAGTDGW